MQGEDIPYPSEVKRMTGGGAKKPRVDVVMGGCVESKRDNDGA